MKEKSCLILSSSAVTEIDLLGKVHLALKMFGIRNKIFSLLENIISVITIILGFMVLNIFYNTGEQKNLHIEVVHKYMLLLH